MFNTRQQLYSKQQASNLKYILVCIMCATTSFQKQKLYFKLSPALSHKNGDKALVASLRRRRSIWRWWICGTGI